MHLQDIFSYAIRNLQAKEPAVRQVNESCRFLLYVSTLKEIKLKITERC